MSEEQSIYIVKTNLTNEKFHLTNNAYFREKSTLHTVQQVFIKSCTWPSTRKIMTEDSSTAAVACFSIIEGILATAASLEASGIPSIPMVVEMANSSMTLACDFETVRTPPVSTTINSKSPQKDLPYRRSLVTPGSSTTIALFPCNT